MSSNHKKAQKELLNNRSEHELLLCCARTNVTPQLVARLRELAATSIDWEYLFLLARRHAVVPLLYIQLERHASDLVPVDTLQELKRHYLENSARNTVLAAELCRLINLFSGDGV
ncbi:MAG TPA: nucleotidyltransferase family protein, partial [Pyrinomonadaceae bacterium]